MKKEGQYVVRLNRGWWAIYQLVRVWDDYNYGLAKVPSEQEYPRDRREDAIRRMYELNGWKYKEK